MTTKMCSLDMQTRSIPRKHGSTATVPQAISPRKICLPHPVLQPDSSKVVAEEAGCCSIIFSFLNIITLKTNNLTSIMATWENRS